jgi:hypothetical protein
LSSSTPETTRPAVWAANHVRCGTHRTSARARHMRCGHDLRVR